MADQQATPVDMAWLAGYIDADGWISMGINHKKRQRWHGGTFLNPKVGFDGTNLDLVLAARRVIEQMGFQPYAVTTQPANSPRARTSYSVRLQRLSSCSAFLGQIIPYLRGKRKQAELLKEFCDIRLKVGGRGRHCPYGPREMELAEQIRRMNRRGVLRDHEQDVMGNDFGRKVSCA